jgi:serine protease Do
VGVRAGDVILAVGDTELGDLKQFEAVVAKSDKAKPLSVTLLRNEWAQYVRIPPSK